MWHNKDYPDGSYDFYMSTYMGSDSIPFGGSRIFDSTLGYRATDGDSLYTEMWTPAGHSFDTSAFLVMFPGYGEHTYALYPLGIAATRAGIRVVFMSARGLDLNANVKRNFYLSEVQDAKDALAEYAKESGLTRLKIGTYGYSLGSVFALDLASEDPQVRGAVLESIMMNPLALASHVVKPVDYGTLMALLKSHPEIRRMSPDSILLNWKKPKPLLLIRGTKDNVIPKSDWDSLAAIAVSHDRNASIRVIDGAPHVMRYGFPLSRKDAIGLNDSIVAFLKLAIER